MGHDAVIMPEHMLTGNTEMADMATTAGDIFVTNEP